MKMLKSACKCYQGQNEPIELFLTRALNILKVNFKTFFDALEGYEIQGVKKKMAP